VDQAHPANAVEVHVREASGLVRVLRAAAADPAGWPWSGAVQSFTAVLPELHEGQAFDYRVLLSRAGQRLATLPEDGSWLRVEGAKPAAGPAAPVGPPDAPRWSYGLTFFAALTVDLRAEILGATPEGYRINFFVKDGTVRGPNIDAIVRPEGGDWMCIRPDGIGIVDITITYETSDGALIMERAGGIFDLGPDGFAKVAGGAFHGSPPFYATPTWQTSHPAWQWINRCQGFGIGRVVLEELQVQCDIYLPTVGGPLVGA
jgi:hypothetical protein